MEFKKILPPVCALLGFFLMKLSNSLFIDLAVMIVCVPVLLFATCKECAGYRRERDVGALARLLFYVVMCVLLFHTISLIVQAAV